MTVDAEGFGTVSSAKMYYHLYPNVGFTFNSQTGQFTTDLTDIDNQNQSAYTEITATPSGKTVSATLTGATGTYYLVVVAKDNMDRYAIFGFQATSTDGITFTGTGGAQQTGSVNGNPAGGGNFAFVSPKITTVVSPAGAGTVTGGGYYAPGATAQLKATANSGYTFKHWLKDGSTNVGSETTINVGVTQNATYTAVFEPMYLVSVSGTGITANPASQSVVSGGTASFALTPSGDYYFPNPLSCATAGGVTVTRHSDTSATLTVQSVTSLMNLNVTGAVRYLGKIGDTYYTDQAALLEAMKNATANTQIVLGSTFSTSAPIQIDVYKRQVFYQDLFDNTVFRGRNFAHHLHCFNNANGLSFAYFASNSGERSIARCCSGVKRTDERRFDESFTAFHCLTNFPLVFRQDRCCLLYTSSNTSRNAGYLS